jgi:hypothetical protein
MIALLETTARLADVAMVMGASYVRRTVTGSV